MADAEAIEYQPRSNLVPLVLGVVGALVVGAGIGFGASYLINADDGAGDTGVAAGAAAPQDPLDDYTDPDAVFAALEEGKTPEELFDAETEGSVSPDAPVILDGPPFEPSYTVNLRGGGGGRILRMSLALETRAKFLPSLEPRMPLVQDSILTLAGDYTYEELEGQDGKARMKQELLDRLNAMLEGEPFDKVYFTGFMVQ